MDSNERRDRAYQAPVSATLAYIEKRYQDLYGTLESAAEEDPLGLSYRLTNLAALAVDELSRRSGEAPHAILTRLLTEDEPQPGGYLIPPPGQATD